MIKVKRKLIKFSNYSLCITVPKKMAQSLGWDRGDLLNLYLNEQDKTIKLSKKKAAIKAEEIKVVSGQEEYTTTPMSNNIKDVKEPVVLYQRNQAKDSTEKNLRW